MNAIKMNRLALFEIVRANLKKHVSEYTEAVDDYKTLVLNIAESNLALAKTGDLTNLDKIKQKPNKPVSYEVSYNRAIRMLELSVDEIIEVEEDVFNQLVLDEWHWKQSFVASNTMYKVGSF